MWRTPEKRTFHKDTGKIPDIFTLPAFLSRPVSLLSRVFTLFHRDYYYFYNTYIRSRRRVLRNFAPLSQISIDKDINIPVKDRIHIADLSISPVIFHKAIRLEDI